MWRMQKPLRTRIINCDLCKHLFHVKCCGVNHKIYNSIKATNTWLCKHCVRINSAATEKDELNSIEKKSKSQKKCKCGKCKKNLSLQLRVINCDACNNFFHPKCSDMNRKSFLDLKRYVQVAQPTYYLFLVWIIINYFWK